MSSPAHRVIRPFGSASSAATVVVGGPLSRDLARVFARHRQIHLVGVCRRSTELLHAVETRGPDVLLLLATQTSQFVLVKLLRQIQARCTTKILILTNRRDPDFIETILRYGAKGCVRTTVGDYVVRAIVAVQRGEVWLERKILANALSALIAELDMGSASDTQSGQVNWRSRLLLTRREREIVALLVHGLTNKEIARTINVSTETVKKHLKNIFNKLGVHRRTQVVRSQLSSG